MSDDPIDQINRFILSLLALAVVFAVLLVVLLAWGAPGGSIDKIRDFAGWLEDNNDNDGKLIITLGGVVVVMLMLALMILELTPSPLQRMRLRDVATGDGSTTTVEIARRVEEDVRGIEHVAEATAIVAARGKKVDVALDIMVDAGADLARTANEACRRAQAVVEEQIGIDLAQRPRARMRYRELRLGEGERALTGWERPRSEGAHDERGSTGASEEAQAKAD